MKTFVQPCNNSIILITSWKTIFSNPNFFFFFVLSTHFRLQVQSHGITSGRGVPSKRFKLLAGAFLRGRVNLLRARSHRLHFFTKKRWCEVTVSGTSALKLLQVQEPVEEQKSLCLKFCPGGSTSIRSVWAVWISRLTCPTFWSTDANEFCKAAQEQLCKHWQRMLHCRRAKMENDGMLWWALRSSPKI